MHYLENIHEDVYTYACTRCKCAHTSNRVFAYFCLTRTCVYTFRLSKSYRIRKNYRNDGIWQSGISKSLAEYVKGCVCFINVQSSLHDNVVFSVCARMDNAAYIMFIMWNSISGSDAWYHFRFIISCGVAVMGRIHQIKFQVIF